MPSRLSRQEVGDTLIFIVFAACEASEGMNWVRAVDLYLKMKESRFRSFLERPEEFKARTFPVPPLIWMYWADGYDSAPDLVKLCIESWRVMNPGWTVTVLDDSSVGKHVDMSDCEGIGLPIQKRANVLRNRLLKEFGGVWCDATLLCGAPLDCWTYFAMQADLFMFKRPGPDRIAANWFIASAKNGYMIEEIDRAYTRYLTSPPPYAEGKDHPTYFNYQYVLEYTCLTNRKFRRAFAGIPKITAHPPHLLQAWLVHPDKAHRGPVPQIRGLPMHKLTWKEEIDIEEVAWAASQIDARLGDLPARKAAASP